MKLLFNKRSGEILDASNLGAWRAPDFATTIEVPGDTETFPWPHPQGPSSCIWDGTAVVINPAILLPSDANKAESEMRGSRSFLALGRIITGNDVLTENELVTLIRAKLS